MPDFLPFTNSQGEVGTNFVDFTTNLVTNVMEVLVDSSIKQLQAYGDMVKAVSGSVQDYQLAVAGIGTNAPATDPSNIPSIDAFALDVLGLALDLASGTAGSITLGPDETSTAVTVLSGATNAADATAEDILFNNQGQPETSVSKSDIAELIFDHLKNKSSQEYELLKFIIVSGLQQIVVTEGHILTRVHMQFSALQQSASSSTTSSTGAKGWAWNARFFGQKKWKSGAFLGGGASGGMYNHKITVSSASAADLSSTSLSASMFGEVKIGFGTRSLPVPEIA